MMRNLIFAILIIILRSSTATTESSPAESDMSWKIVAGVLLSGIILMLSIIVFLMWRLFKLKRHIEANVEDPTPTTNDKPMLALPNLKILRSLSNNEAAEWGESLIVGNSDDLNLEPDYEINENQLYVSGVIEEGYFSVVQKGKLKWAKPRNREEKAKRLEVTVKGAINQEDKTQQRMILDELMVMCEMRKHPNTLALVGYVVNSTQMLIVSELIDKNLLEYLKERQGNFKDGSDSFESVENVDEQNGFYNIDYPELTEEFDPLSSTDLLSFAYQIANGMKYITSISFVHRQLALRNIFITNDKTIRIGELGLARRHGNNEYYRIMTTEVPLPFHLMAPETFKDHKFTEKSDVWSYGVCLWELFTLGKMPYEGVGDVLTFLNEGRRLAQPEYCSEVIYNFMKTCWNMDASTRPSFSECGTFFEDELRKQDAQALTNMKQSLDEVRNYQRQLENWANKTNFDDDSGDSV